MGNARSQHPNAVLTPEGRRRMVACVLDDGWPVEAVAERFQVDAKTVRKWRGRFLAEGDAGLLDRSCRPRRSPNQTPPSRCAEVAERYQRDRPGDLVHVDVKKLAGIPD